MMPREFFALAEIEALEGFSVDNTMRIDQYACVVGPYDLGDFVPCGLTKPNGSVCREPHKKGWLVTTINRDLVLVGGTCAGNHFPEDAQIHDDARRVANEIARLRDLALAEELLAKARGGVAAAQDALAKVADLRKEVRRIEAGLGSAACRALDAMARTGVGDVTVIGRNVEVYDGEFGPETQYIDVAIRVGAIKAPHVARRAFSLRAVDDLRAIAAVCRNVQSASIVSTRRKEAKQLSASLAGQTRAIDDVMQLLADGEQFVSNHFEILAFQIRDRAARYKLVQGAMALRGVTLSGEKAKTWVREAEQRWKDEYRVQRIVIK